VTNAEEARGVVRAVDWHSNGEVVCVASLDRTLRLFSLSPDDADAPVKLQSVRLADLPLTHALFTSDSSSIVCSGTSRHFYVYDVAGGVLERVAALTGRAHDDAKLSQLALLPDVDAMAFSDSRGRIQFVSQRSRQWLYELHCGSAQLSALAVRNSTLVCSTRDGDVLEWDLRTRRCLSRWHDHGAMHTTALATASSKWVATGSDVGAVNIYRGEDFSAPHKTWLNLTTEITTLAFNSDAQLLALASQNKSNALRFVHLPSCTVFSNFPRQNTPLSRVTALAFSPSSSHVAIGTARGKVLLYRLHHYHSHSESIGNVLQEGV
jgi:U3 small nucleolar RNA-associated protein 18